MIVYIYISRWGSTSSSHFSNLLIDLWLWVMSSAEGELNSKKITVGCYVTARQLTSTIKRKIFIQLTINVLSYEIFFQFSVQDIIFPHSPCSNDITFLSCCKWNVLSSVEKRVLISIGFWCISLDSRSDRNRNQRYRRTCLWAVWKGSW